MRFGLVTPRTTNIGDEIQAVAAAQYLPSIDLRIDRDRMSESAAAGPVAAILNGWYMYGPAHDQLASLPPVRKFAQEIRNRLLPSSLDWPPPASIRPLFVSFHAGNRLLFHRRFRGYYKLHEPIGCRDRATAERFCRMGIRAYFSGCLTLTLRPEAPVVGREGVYLVDPFQWVPGETGFRDDLWRRLPARLREQGVVLTHHYREHDPVRRFEKAKELLRIYAGAELVVTSRIHCALPCLALGTPVIFVHRGAPNPRFGGLIDLFRSVSHDELATGRSGIDWESPQPNPVDVSQIAAGLRKHCERFVRDSEGAVR